jgi:predicted DNA-binding transcriptional regulator AlpA
MSYKTQVLNTSRKAQGSPAPDGASVSGVPAKHARTPLVDPRSAQAPKSRRVHRKEAAHYLGVSLSWLDKSRMTGRGPAFIKIGSRIVYDVADLDSYLRQNRRETGFGP